MLSGIKDKDRDKLLSDFVSMTEEKCNYVLISFGKKDDLNKIPAIDYSSFYSPDEEDDEEIDPPVFQSVSPYLRDTENGFVIDYYFESVNANKNIVYRYLQPKGVLFDRDIEESFFLRCRRSIYEQTSSSSFLKDIKTYFPSINIASYCDDEKPMLNHVYYAFGNSNGVKGVLARARLIRLAMNVSEYQGLNEDANTPEKIFGLPVKLLFFLEKSNHLLRQTLLETTEKRSLLFEEYCAVEKKYPELHGMTLPMVFACEKAAEIDEFAELRKLLPLIMIGDSKEDYFQYNSFVPGADLCVPIITTPADGRLREWEDCEKNGEFLIYSFAHMSQSDYIEKYRGKEIDMNCCEDYSDRTDFLRSEGYFGEAYSIDSQVYAHLCLRGVSIEKRLKCRLLMARDLEGMQESLAAVSILHDALAECRNTIGNTHKLTLKIMFEFMNELMKIDHYEDAGIIGTELFGNDSKSDEEREKILEILRQINKHLDIYGRKNDYV